MSGSATYALAGTVGKLTGLVTIPVLTRTLGQADYGLVDLAVGLIGLAAIVGGMSAELPAATIVAREPARRKTVLTTYLVTAAGLGLCLGLGMLMASDWIAGSLWRQADAVWIVVLAGLATPLTATQWAAWNIHRIHDRPSAYAVLSTADLVMKATAMVVAALVTGSVVVIVGVYVAATVAGTGLGLWSIRDSADRPDFSVAWPLVAGGAPFTVIAVASIIALYAVRATVAQIGLAEVGNMAVSLRLAGLLALPLAAFQLAWGPASMASSPSRETQATIGREVLVIIVAGSLAALALSLISHESILLIAGAAFAGAEQSLPGLAISTVLGTAFFMLSVATSVRQTGRRRIVTAAILGAAIQVGVTSALLDAGVQVAIGMGALAGPSAALLLVIWTTDGVSFDDRIRIALAVTMLGAIGIALLVMVPVVPFVARWIVATATAAVLCGAVFAVLRSRRWEP
ncbi:MAG: oligosaccharide flippase family protein [Chloroflexi bacterium]|nr:oligosaccharide flippase family protein [Chloroflexota bacterium]